MNSLMHDVKDAGATHNASRSCIVGELRGTDMILLFVVYLFTPAQTGSHMEQLPDQPTPQRSTQAGPVRVVHISVQPKSWLGKLVDGILALALVVIGFFVSIIVFAVAACIAGVAILYFVWITRRARRAMRDQVIEGEVKSRDIH